MTVSADPLEGEVASRPKILLIVGYFDWFSGYQETVLAKALALIADVEIVCSDRVSPAFSEDHLNRIRMPRRYMPGSVEERGVTVTRIMTGEWRSMVWGQGVMRAVRAHPYDLCIQVMPGQFLPAAASIANAGTRRVVLYGDNRAMYEGLSRKVRIAKWIVFALSKGPMYTFTNLRADVVYGYTPNTLQRLRLFSPGKTLELLPLAFDATTFYFDSDLRAAQRDVRGYARSDIVIMAAGKFEERKRLDWVIQAFEQIASKRPDVQLLLTGGDGSPFADSVRTSAANSIYGDRIQVEGFLDAPGLNGAFNAADIGIWPKQPAITIQQAMGTGLLVCLPANDLVGHLISPGSGSYFRGGSEKSAVAAIASTLSCLVAEDPTGCESRLRRCAQNVNLSADATVSAILDRININQHMRAA